MNLYFMLQLPEEYGMRVDLNTFFNVFSMWNERNERVRVRPWDAGPGFRYMNNDNAMDLSPDNDSMMETLDDSRFFDQEQVRGPMRAKWAQYYHRTASHIPYAVCKATPAVNIHDELDIDETGVESTLREPQMHLLGGTQIRPQSSNNGGGRPGGKLVSRTVIAAGP